ncbi:unnamed protein product [Caenorhabditis auriculariae]|uniref:Uncharacterized protein n=1 Tax=Caenorhabditis auriculariae TaxID=2777116 RepID=A0A8S1HGY8_9PELO|nr:unnamed protein product [Caenorhabditis auriculariae]
MQRIPRMFNSVAKLESAPCSFGAFLVSHWCSTLCTKKSPKSHGADLNYAPECKKAEYTVRHPCRVCWVKAAGRITIVKLGDEILLWTFLLCKHCFCARKFTEPEFHQQTTMLRLITMILVFMSTSTNMSTNKKVGNGPKLINVDLLENPYHANPESITHEESFERKDLTLRDEFTRILNAIDIPDVNKSFYAILSVVLISVAPLVILFSIPVGDVSLRPNNLLRLLLAFGAGGLLGDAFLHLIPGSMESHGHDHGTIAGHGHEIGHGHVHGHGHSHSHDNFAGGFVLTGFFVFVLIEKIIRSIRPDNSHVNNHHYVAVNGKLEKIEKKSKVAAYLNLAADFAHNFTDGLAIGASYCTGRATGFMTTVTVLVHEVPHEIGDFAILINSGFTKKTAVQMQLVTAFGALSGCVIALILTDISGSSIQWISPFTAGGFIYIAAVSIIPELITNEAVTLLDSIAELAALFLGVILMYLVGLLE